MSQVSETVHFYCWNNKTFQDNRQGILSRTRLKTSFITRLIKRWRTCSLVGRNAILRTFVKNLSGYNEDEIMDYIIIFTCNCGFTNKQIFINSQKYSSLSPTANEVAGRYRFNKRLSFCPRGRGYPWRYTPSRGVEANSAVGTHPTGILSC